MNGQIIIFARHGQTDFNLEKRVQDPINPRLTKIGHEQAQVTKKEIEKLGIVFDLIICSDMTRNIETLAEIYPDYKKMDNVKIDSRLQERYHRDLVGKTKYDIEKEIGKKFTDRFSWQLYFEGTEKSELTKLKYSNDETLDSIKNRLASLFSEFKNKNKILLIGSSIFNQYILEFLSTGTIGINKPQSPDGHVIDFQENNELRIVTLDENMKIINYSSISY
jgi:broad specificity phosphatase PhoE